MTETTAIPEWRRWVDRIGFIPARLAWGVAGDAPLDLDTAKRVAAVVEEACRTLHTGASFPGDAGAPRFTDDAVERVIEALCHEWDLEGRNRSRGAWRCRAHPEAGHPHPLRADCRYPPEEAPADALKVTWYDLRALPPATRRALVERIWRIWWEWSRGGATRLALQRHYPPSPFTGGGAPSPGGTVGGTEGTGRAGETGTVGNADDWTLWIG